MEFTKEQRDNIVESMNGIYLYIYKYLFRFKTQKDIYFGDNNEYILKINNKSILGEDNNKEIVYFDGETKPRNIEYEFMLIKNWNSIKAKLEEVINEPKMIDDTISKFKL